MNIYREEILEHWRNPQNFGEMKNAHRVIEQINPLCGDRVTFYFKIKDGKVKDVSFTGSGCAISMASASILTDAIKNKTLSSILKMSGDDVLELIGEPRRRGFGGQTIIPPARLKCVFLALEAIKKLEA